MEGEVMPAAKLLISAMIALCVLAGAAGAQQQFIYPSHDQSASQQDQDKYQCSQWATQQTAFNPTQPPPIPQASAPPPPGLFGGAAGGAALGAVGGAIGGNAGEGAGIGAGVGALFGAIRRHRYAQEQEYNADRQTSGYMTERSNYFRAMDACLVGRGYTVN
jgi:Glycine zipper